MNEEIEEYVDEKDDYIDICVGPSEWKNHNGQSVEEADYRVGGDVWRVHKSDADPFPSSPHAHCVGGSKRIIGCKLHLGTGELFKKRKSLRKWLDEEQFHRLTELIQPKFPNIKLPLE